MEHEGMSNTFSENRIYTSHHERTISKTEISMKLTSPIMERRSIVSFSSNNENIDINIPTYKRDSTNNRSHNINNNNDNNNNNNNNNNPIHSNTNTNLFHNYEMTKFHNYIHDNNQHTNNLFNEVITNDNYNTDIVLNSLSTIIGGFKNIHIESNESSANIKGQIEDLQGSTKLLAKDNVDLINLQKQILRTNRTIILQNAITQQYNLIMTFDKKDDTAGFNFRMFPENKYINLRKRVQFIIRILSLFLSDNGFEISSAFYINIYTEQGREAFRNALKNYVYSIIGIKPRLVYEKDENKYIMFES